MKVVTARVDIGLGPLLGGGSWARGGSCRNEK